MRLKANVAAFFDFDETIIDINSSKVGFKWLYENNMLTKMYILKVLGLALLSKFNIITEKRMAEIMIAFYKNKKLEFFVERADEFYHDLLKPHLVPSIIKKIAVHKNNHVMPVIVSGSIRYYLKPAAEDLGIKHIICTDLQENEKGVLTGKPIGQVCIGEYKAKLVQKFSINHNINLQKSFAYGNNQADIPMLNLVGNPVVVQPTSRLRKIAIRKNWPIITYR